MDIRRRERDVRMHDPIPHLNGSAPSSNPIVSPSISTNGSVSSSSSNIIQKINLANEQTWLVIGRVAEQMNDLDHALSAYEHALRHNPMSLSGLTQIAGIARIKENYPKAVEYFQRVLQMQEENGEVWSALGHCYLMQDDLQKAYSAYQQALYLLPNPKEDPKLWYGIGILYDRYGSLDHAEEAFSSVLRMDKDLDFDKANEILFRLGIIYKQQGKYDDSLNCFDRILRNPPSPLAHADIWFQIGHVHEQQKDHMRAKSAYELVVRDNPGHAKVLQQLGWLYHQEGSTFQNQDTAISYLTKSLEADSSDAQSWYLLGRAYMAGQKYNKAYEAYQQAVYRDGRNPTFWCSIGVLYFQINQFRDALDAYSRAIRINPYISEVWFDLGSLYESCNNQISDAIDAYARAAELDPNNNLINTRLQLLKTAQATGGQLPAAPGPQDVHPTAYASAVIPPSSLSGPSLLLSSAGNQRPLFRSDSRGPSNEISLPPPSQVTNGHSSPPFRGGPPPPVIIDESRQVSSHTALAPMDIERRDYPLPSSRENGRLLENGINHFPESSSYLIRRAHSRSASPAASRHERSLSRSRRAISPPFSSYAAPQTNGNGNGRHQPMGPGQPATRSPRLYSHPPSRGPASPSEPSPRSTHGGPPSRFWENKPLGRHPSSVGRPSPPPPPRVPSYDTLPPRTTIDRDRAPQRPRRSRDGSETSTPKPYERPGYAGSKGSPEPISSGGSSSKSQPSPTNSRAPVRVVDEDYDEPGVADALMGLAGYHRPSREGSHSPTVSSGSRHSEHHSHRSIDPSPPPSVKRPRSSGPDEGESKRVRLDNSIVVKRRASSPMPPMVSPVPAPLPSTRPSPIPFRTQPSSHSSSHSHSQSPPYHNAPSPQHIPLPPHPRPIGNGNGNGISLPPIASLSPQHEDERMQVDSGSVGSPTEKVE